MTDSNRLIEAMVDAMFEADGNGAPNAPWIDLARASITAIEAAGYRVVPVEPTEEMADAGTDARWQSVIRDANNVREIWTAMLSAAPKVSP